MSNFLTSPEGNAYSLFRIGGAKAIESGFLLLGSGAEEILEYIPTPTGVALAWRDALVTMLSGHRPNRPIRQIDWVGLAADVDFEWASAWAPQNGWIAPAAPTEAGTQPVRRPGQAALAAD